MNQPPTPGPWVFAYGAVYQGSIIDETANRLMLADRSNPRTTPCERDANARLCAAAPNLWAVLNAVRVALRFNQPSLVADLQALLPRINEILDAQTP